ncbi:leucyl aminopeptidase [Tepidiforma sp.]|uniref:leucyl aminopeptidase n=1 Tax=Tepidiforma sp. TaxID=2682230 RepID=UPI002ADD92CD|nr:leucyl aminopeptidase [Tepidiforma sp.]
MKVRVSEGDIARFEADAVVVNLFEGVTAPGGGTGAVDRALDGAISRLIAEGDIRGKAGELVTVHTLGRLPAPRVVVAGLGSREGFDIDAVRNLAANVVRALRRPGIRRVATLAHGAGIGGLDPEACAQAIAEGSLLGGYRFLKHKSAADDERAEIGEVVIVEHDAAKVAAMQRAVERGVVLAEATNLARDWANEPSNHLTPTIMAERSAQLAREAGLEIEVLDREQMEAKGMGSLLSVAKGSAEPPKLIRLGYRGRGGDGWDLALVGKGITFDTGGISIKPAANMEAMKADMTGAASVIAAAWAIARLGAKVNVLAIAPCTENMPSGSATKPGDVVRAMNGRTIEVINTDAEGRLVLADALCWANELGAKRIVDVATLTGAVTTALGDVCYALMTNDDAFCREVEAAAAAAGEKTWRLPMWKEYDEYIKSDVADCRNVGAGNRGAGTIVGAKFLEPFAGKTPWVHMDIAGVDNMSSDRGWVTKGASGYSVRAMINLALRMAEG